MSSSPPSTPLNYPVSPFLPPENEKGFHHAIRCYFIQLGHFLFSARNILFPLTFIVLVIVTRPEFLFGSERADWGEDFLGVVIAFSGQVCRALAISQAENIRRGGRQKRVAAKRLIRHGVYAHTRNPLYLGNLLIIGGLGVIANNQWWYLIALPLFVGVYWSIVFAEEDFLARQFGQEYMIYYHSVNRFLPSLSGIRESCMQYPFDWQRVFRKEYSVVCSWMSMATILLIWERWERFGYVARRTQIHELLVFLLSLLALYVSVVGWRIRRKAPSEKSLPLG